MTNGRYRIKRKEFFFFLIWKIPDPTNWSDQEEKRWRVIEGERSLGR